MHQCPLMRSAPSLTGWHSAHMSTGADVNIHASTTSFPEDASALLLSAMHPLFGTRVTRAFLSIQAGTPATSSSSAPTQAPRYAEVRATDHCVRLNPHRFAFDSADSPTVLVAAPDIESLVRAYQSATLTARVLMRQWSAVIGPLAIPCPHRNARAPQVSTVTLDGFTPYVDALLAIPLSTRIVVARTLFTVLSRPGRQADLAHRLHMSRSTLRNHLAAVAAHLPAGLQPHENPALADVLPTLVNLWSLERERPKGGPSRPFGAVPLVPAPRPSSGQHLSPA